MRVLVYKDWALPGMILRPVFLQFYLIWLPKSTNSMKKTFFGDVKKGVKTGKTNFGCVKN